MNPSNQESERKWNPTSERLPEVNIPVIGFSDRWVDDDFNPKGMRECFRTDEAYWLCAAWNNYQDTYETLEDRGPSHWMNYPDVPI